MSDLSTTYLGLKLNSPVILGSCSLSKKIDNIIAAEQAGAGAIVIKSLFEEQLQMEAIKLSQELEKYENMIGEALSFHPAMEHGGPSEYLMWLKKARKAVKMPIIGSLNAISPGKWIDYAVKMAETGIDALELNMFGIITDPSVSGHDVILSMVETLKEVNKKVRIPIAVKMSPYFASPAFAAKYFDTEGADALVLFNRFAQPDIDIESESLKFDMTYSHSCDLGHTLRWTGLLYGKVTADLCASTGIFSAEDVVKALLAGANSVQVVSSVMQNGIEFISTLNEGLDNWMKAKGYGSIANFRGKASEALGDDSFGYERAHYIKALLGFD